MCIENTEPEELKIWIKENQSDLSDFHLKKLKEKVGNIEFVNYKMDGKYKECIKILSNSNVNLLKMKALLSVTNSRVIFQKTNHISHCRSDINSNYK